MTDEVNDVAADTNAEVEETTNSNQTGTEDATVIAEKLADALKAKAALTARAKKAEEELKTLKGQPQVNNNNDPQLSDELKLIARGLSDEEIEQAKIIAKGKGISLTEATKDSLFQIYQSDLKDKQKKEKAKLGALKGSGESQEELTGIQSGSTRDEHKKAFQKLVGK